MIAYDRSTSISYRLPISYDEPYTVIGILNPEGVFYGDLARPFAVGDEVRFVPVYSCDWGMDVPIRVDILRNGKPCGSLQRVQIELCFAYGTDGDAGNGRVTYQLADEPDAMAVLAGVPKEDVFV